VEARRIMMNVLLSKIKIPTAKKKKPDAPAAGRRRCVDATRFPVGQKLLEASIKKPRCPSSLPSPSFSHAPMEPNHFFAADVRMATHTCTAPPQCLGNLWPNVATAAGYFAERILTVGIHSCSLPPPSRRAAGLLGPQRLQSETNAVEAARISHRQKNRPYKRLCSLDPRDEYARANFCIIN